MGDDPEYVRLQPTGNFNRRCRVRIEEKRRRCGRRVYWYAQWRGRGRSLTSAYFCDAHRPAVPQTHGRGGRPLDPREVSGGGAS